MSSFAVYDTQMAKSYFILRWDPEMGLDARNPGGREFAINGLVLVAAIYKQRHLQPLARLSDDDTDIESCQVLNGPRKQSDEVRW